MTPDKLYLVKDAANPEGIFDTVASKKPMFQDDVCYIRKDALIEWLLKGVEMSEICHSEYGDACAQAYQAVIDKLNSM